MSFLASVAGGIGEGMQQTGDMFAKKALIEAEHVRKESLLRLGIQLQEESDKKMDEWKYDQDMKRKPEIAKLETQIKIDSARTLTSQIAGMSPEQEVNFFSSMLGGPSFLAEREKLSSEDRKFMDEMTTEEYEEIEKANPDMWDILWSKFYSNKPLEKKTPETMQQMAEAAAYSRFRALERGTGRNAGPTGGARLKTPGSPVAPVKVPRPDFSLPEHTKQIPTIVTNLIEETGSIDEAIKVAKLFDDEAFSALMVTELESRREVVEEPIKEEEEPQRKTKDYTTPGPGFTQRKQSLRTTMFDGIKDWGSKVRPR